MDIEKLAEESAIEFGLGYSEQSTERVLAKFRKIAVEACRVVTVQMDDPEAGNMLANHFGLTDSDFKETT